MFAKVYSAALIGLDACPVSVEIDISRGLPQIVIVGLPDAAVNEARERVKSAIKASGHDLPMGSYCCEYGLQQILEKKVLILIFLLLSVYLLVLAS